MAETIEEALRGYLQTTDVSVLVSGRIRTGVANVNDPKPFVVIEPPTVFLTLHTDGDSGLSESLVPIHCEAASYQEARTVASAVFDLFKAGYQGFFNNLTIRNVWPTIRGKPTNVVAGDQHGFQSLEVQLRIWHATE